MISDDEEQASSRPGVTPNTIRSKFMRGRVGGAAARGGEAAGGERSDARGVEVKAERAAGDGGAARGTHGAPGAAGVGVVGAVEGQEAGEGGGYKECVVRGTMGQHPERDLV